MRKQIAACLLGMLLALGVSLSAQNWIVQNGSNSVRANTSLAAVSIRQDGTGKILSLLDGATEVFSVADGGALTTTGAWSLTGNLTIASGVILAPNGSASAPPYAFSATPTTGIFHNVSPERIALTFSGTQKFEFRADTFYMHSTTAMIGFGDDTYLTRDAANILSMENGANHQLFRTYDASSNWVGIGSVAGTIGIHTSSAIDLYFAPGGTTRWGILAGAPSTGALFATSDGAYDFGLRGANRPRDVHVARDTIVAGQVLARESFDQPHVVLEEDFTPKVLTDTGINVVLGSPSGIVEFREEQLKTASSWVEVDGQLDITADNTIDNEGVEIYLGDDDDQTTGWVVAQTSGRCFTVNFTIALIAGTDQFVIGWRQNEVFQDVANYAGYNDWSVVGINNVDGSIFSMAEVAGGGTLSDDSGVNAANGDTRSLRSCILTNGTRTAEYTATGSSTFVSITLANGTTAHTAGDQLNPFISYLQAGGAVDANIRINYWEITTLP